MLLYGNLLSLIGCAIMVCIGLIKKKNNILIVQCVQFTFMGVGQLLLGAMAGVAANVVSIFRNILFTKIKPTLAWKLVFIAFQAALTFYLGFDTAFEALPIIAVAMFTLSLSLKSDVQFKLVIAASQLLWLVYDVHHRNFVNASADVLTVVTTLVGIWMIQKNKKNEPAEASAGSNLSLPLG